MRISPIHHLAAVLAVVLISTAAHATAGSPGTLDPFWGTGSTLGAGKVMTPVGPEDDTVRAIVVQPDGKVVLAGECLNANSVGFTAFCAARYSAGGVLDTSFNVTGKVVTAIGAGFARAQAIALQADGKLVLVGVCSIGLSSVFCAARYNVDGTLDTSFNSSGTVLTAMASANDRAAAVVVQADGKLVLAGSCIRVNKDFCALRYNADGTLDLPFGGLNTGKVFTSISANFDNAANAISLQPDGKLVLAGSCLGTNYDFCALRYNADGTLDTVGFGVGGKVISAVGSDNDYANALALQPDGKLVLAGDCWVGGNRRFCAVRYLGNGTLDPNFGAGGKVITPVGSSGVDSATALVLQPDGKLVLAGYCLNGTLNNFCALRYHANGTHLDTTFNGIGALGTAVGSGNANANAAALQPDGKLMLAGSCSNGTNNDFCVARYDGGPFGYKNCSLDIDGDNRVLATTDSLIHARIALGITGPAVVNGITFPTNATRNTWPLIRDYLVSQCGMSLQL